MPITIPTYQLDELIAASSASTTLQQLRTSQLEALPFQCPQCDGDGLIETGGILPDGEPVTGACPLCNGMGKTPIQYYKVCTAYQYTPNNPEPIS